MSKDYSRSVELLCPTCASSAFSFDDSLHEDLRTYACAVCGGTFDHDLIMKSNSERIEAEISAIGEDFLGDAIKKLRKATAKNKFIKFK